ncbi:MAG: hypothetical protein B7Z20_02100 [Sphingobium sp. 32-64-5]|nr:MAG: hypothetical protein B7Z20_02100 [Sphingobium sp. 32-64-5]
MPILTKPVRFFLMFGMLPTALAGCGDVADPALREAVQTPLASDPDLAAEANRDAVRPADRPLSGAVPARLASTPDRAEALRLAGGKLMPTPAATASGFSTRDAPITLGGLIRQQQERSDTPDARCDAARIDYAMKWARLLPTALPLYPGANVMEAAGGGTAGPCAFRAVSFTTGGALNEVMDFYTTMAKRSGYSVEHVEHNGGHVLSGGKDKGSLAYHIRFQDRQGGGTAVDLIANDGR